MGGARQRASDLLTRLKAKTVREWSDLSEALEELATEPLPEPGDDPFRSVAFLTYDYGIDGVSMEIVKYARCIEAIQPGCRIHMLGGEFTAHADGVLDEGWSRCVIPDANGWGKWDNGKWFARLFEDEMPEGSAASSEMAGEIWRQALLQAEVMNEYVLDQDVQLLIPVNVNSNPGNPATGLAAILVSECTGVRVVNSNHDFYWEGGQPASAYGPDEERGVRDHFFRNVENRPFFALFEALYPWNGRRWVQANINPRQRDWLIDERGFSDERVQLLGTAIEESFFEPADAGTRLHLREAMSCILSDGQYLARAVPVDVHLDQLEEWMQDQTPIVVGARGSLDLDYASESAIVLLQPTRVLERKRIEKNCELLDALFGHEAFQEAFDQDPNRTLTLHVSGPVPIEHLADLRRVVEAYRKTVQALPADLAIRVFLAFSCGQDQHPGFRMRGFEPLRIDQIYKLADLVLFPSQTEGRGLPIPESAAAGVPIVCTRYAPHDVFDAVVQGETGAPLQVTLLPEDEMPSAVLDEITSLIFRPQRYAARRDENRNVARERFAMSAIGRSVSRLAEAAATEPREEES